MITITVDLKSHKYQQSFNKDDIIIGSSSAASVDILLSLADIKEEHVKIDFKNNSYYVYNIANDPFVTLNGMPFGKRRIHEGDCLVIHSVEIFVDRLGEPEKIQKEEQPIEAVLNSTGHPLRELVEQKILEKSHHVQEIRTEAVLEKDSITEDEYKELENHSPKHEQSLLFDLENEEKEENNSELDISEIESLLEEAERLESILNDDNLNQSKEIIELFNEDQNEINNLKHIFKKDGEEDLNLKESEALSPDKNPEIKKNHFEPISVEDEQPKRNRKIGLWLLFIGLLLAFLVILAALELSGNPTRSQIINAAQTGADTSMSLLNAKLHHLKPHNQNWSDPNFLKDSLNTILSSRYQPFLDFDTKGTLVASRYILRLYNTRDLSRFLVVLHPSSSIINWLSPNKAVLIDSQSMQVRLFSNFKPLQKVLTSSHTLDSIDQDLLTTLINQGDIMPLAELTNEGQHPEFKVSNDLAAISPGADHLIYNAPRYFKLTAAIADEAAEIGLELENPPALTGLAEQLATLAQLPKLVIYSIEGLHGAMMVQKGIMAAGFNNIFPIAYLIFDSKNNIGLESEIIPEISEPEVKEIAEAHEDNREPIFIKSIEAVHEYPVNYKDLNPEEFERLERLKPVKSAMIDLITNHSISPVDNFYDRIQALLESYEVLDNELIAESNEVSSEELHLEELHLEESQEGDEDI